MTGSPSSRGGVTTVFTTVDTNAMIMAKLMLEIEGIPIIASGEGLQDLFGMGRSVGAFNPVVGPMRIQVAAVNLDERKIDFVLAKSTEQARGGSGSRPRRRKA